MAGEWIKFENSLPEKPETLAITAAMGWTDPDLTVGKLMRLFRWFDQQTTDGNAARVTPALLDHVLGVTGLTHAVESVGWLTVTDGGISLSKFDRHNGESAKQRAQTAKRVAKHKGNAKANGIGNAPGVTSALPKEEKRREEKIPPTPKGDDEAFERFWTAYPRKVGKDAARKAFDKRKPSGEMVASMLTALASQIHSPNWTKDDGQFIPHPTTWLNEGRWQDEVGGSVDGGSRFAGCI